MSIQTYAPQQDMPPPVTSGTTLQTFTDNFGELWVAKNGVNGGAWRRPRDVLQSRVYRSAAFTTSTTAGIFGWDTVWRDTYGMWVGNPSYWFLIPITGFYRISFDISCAATAANHWYQGWIRVNSVNQTDDASFSTSLASATLFTRSTALVYCAANDQIVTQHQSSAAFNGNPSNLYCHFECVYMGTG